MESQATSSKKPKSNLAKPLLITGAAVVVCGLSFYSGIAYQKSKTGGPSTAQTSLDGNMPSSNFSRGPRMTPSTVTAISDTSITIKTSSGESKTYAISSSTAIVKDEGTATAADIAVGNTALVISDDGTNASRIIVNPPEDGGPRTFNNGTETPGVQTN